MENLIERMAKANGLLQPYAVPHEGTLGRIHAENADGTRFPFQRDIDRVLYSDAYRRLKGKTQVFVGGGGDHYRTRLTHTMEVARVSRNVARTLGLNEDLAECIALAHDLGHPPFGHSGEDALDTWMKSQGSSFEHNEQSLRIVKNLSSHSSLFPGLNLDIEVYQGLMKHRTPHDHPDNDSVELPSLEALVVNLSDEIAYSSHDIDDGIREGLFSIDQLQHIPLIAKCIATGKKLGSALTHILIMNVYEETEKQIQQQNITTLDDVYMFSENPVRFSDTIRTDLDILRVFLTEHMYFHPDVLEQVEEGKTIVTALCEHLYDHPTQEVQDLQDRTQATKVEAVKDYVSGMTDSYAMEIAARLGLLA